MRRFTLALLLATAVSTLACNATTNRSNAKSVNSEVPTEAQLPEDYGSVKWVVKDRGGIIAGLIKSVGGSTKAKELGLRKSGRIPALSNKVLVPLMPTDESCKKVVALQSSAGVVEFELAPRLQKALAGVTLESKTVDGLGIGKSEGTGKIVLSFSIDPDKPQDLQEAENMALMLCDEDVEVSRPFYNK